MLPPEMRKKALKAIWSKTHKDFKDKLDGKKTILTWRNGTTLVFLEDLTDKEIADKLPKDFSFN